MELRALILDQDERRKRNKKKFLENQKVTLI